MLQRLHHKLLAMALMTVTLPSYAFLNDTSNQRVVMIGKGGAQNMQPVVVQEITTVKPADTYIAPPPTAYQPLEQTTSYPAQYPTYQTYPSQSLNPLNEINLRSAAAAVFDLQSGELLYDKNIDKVRSIASVTKMMTAMVVLDSGQNMSDELVISPSDLVGAKSASTRLYAGDRMSRSEMMLLMLMKSENPAAKALASNYYGGHANFIAAMNQKAKSLGMYNTNFSDASGLNPRNRSSASDLLIMMREIALNPRYQTIRNFSSTPSYDFYIPNYNKGGRTYKAATTSRLIRSGSYNILASKTGYIKEAGYCVVMQTAINNRPAIIVLLGAGDSSSRWADAETILAQLAYR